MGINDTKSLGAARQNLGYSRCRPQRPFAEAVMRIHGAECLGGGDLLREARTAAGTGRAKSVREFGTPRQQLVGLELGAKLTPPVTTDYEGIQGTGIAGDKLVIIQ